MPIWPSPIPWMMQPLHPFPVTDSEVRMGQGSTKSWSAGKPHCPRRLLGLCWPSIVDLCRERLVETGDHRSWSWCRSQHRRLTAVQFTWQSSPRCRFCLASLSSLRWLVCHACAGSIHTASRFSLKFQLPIGVWRRLGANHGLYGLYDCRCHMYCFHMPPNSIHFKLGKHCASPWWSKVSEHHHIISHASIRDERHYKSMNKGKKRLRRSQAC